MNSKQRAMLRGMANTMETILYIGKDGVVPGTIKQASDALRPANSSSAPCSRAAR